MVIVRRRQKFPIVTDAEIRDRLEIEIGRMLALGKYPSSYSVLEATGFSTRNDRARKMLDELLDATAMPAEFVERRRRNKAVNRAKSCEARRPSATLDDPRVIEHRIRAVRDARAWYGRNLEPDEFVEVLERVEAAQLRKAVRAC